MLRSPSLPTRHYGALMKRQRNASSLIVQSGLIIVLAWDATRVPISLPPSFVPFASERTPKRRHSYGIQNVQQAVSKRWRNLLCSTTRWWKTSVRLTCTTSASEMMFRCLTRSSSSSPAVSGIRSFSIKYIVSGLHVKAVKYLTAPSLPS